MTDTYADRWAVVTGASSGLGAEFARTLAARGMHLILVARRERRLHDLAAELDTKHGTHCEVLPADLSDPAERDRVHDAAVADGRAIELLVNSAGFGVAEDLPHTDRAAVLDLVSVNIAALTDLTYRFLPAMTARGHGGVLNLSSLAGFTPVAYMGAYSASKAYVLHFSEALWAEVRDRGVTVTAVCPAATRTEFFEVAGVGGWLKKRRGQDPEAVVRTALRAFERGRPVVVTGALAKLQVFLMRFAPRRTKVLESRKYFRPVPRPDERKPPAAHADPPDVPVRKAG